MFGDCATERYARQRDMAVVIITLVEARERLGKIVAARAPSSARRLCVHHTRVGGGRESKRRGGGKREVVYITYMSTGAMMVDHYRHPDHARVSFIQRVERMLRCWQAPPHQKTAAGKPHSFAIKPPT